MPEFLASISRMALMALSVSREGEVRTRLVHSAGSHDKKYSFLHVLQIEELVIT